MNTTTNLKNNLWLDDERLPPSDEWFWAKTAQEARDWLEENADRVEQISLDHDLGPEEAGTGYHVACWLEVNECFHSVPGFGKSHTIKVNIHSANPVGAKKMCQALEDDFEVTQFERSTYIEFLKNNFENQIKLLQQQIEETTNSLNKLE